MAYIGKLPATQGKDAGPALKIDDISGDFDGLTKVFDLKVNEESVDPHINNISIFLSGVHQVPGDSFRLSGSRIVFSAAPSASLDFHGAILGATRILVPDNATVETRAFTNDTIVSISGSLGANASTIRTLSSTTISGSFTAPSSSLASRITTAESELGNTLISSSAQIAQDISGSRDATSISGSRDAASISGSLGANASTIRTLSSTTVSGSLGANASTIRTLSATTISGSRDAASISGSFGNQRVGTTDNVKFNNITGSNNISASGNLSITGNVDVDGTSNFAGNVTLQNDLTVTGRIDAEEIHTTFISSSIAQATGSNIFGDATTDSHQFTGSMDVSGSLRVSDGNVVVSDTLTATNIGAFTSTGAINFNSQAMTNVDINSGTINGITDLAVADGGTGASTAAGAAENLGLGITDNVVFSAISGSTGEFTSNITGSGNLGADGDLYIGGKITGSGLAVFNDNVGIGTTVMDALVNINSGAANAGLHVESTDSSANISLADNLGSAAVINIGGRLVFETGGTASTAASSGTESMTISGSLGSAGNVGIGTDSPTGQLTIASSTSPTLTFKDTGGGTDSKIFKLSGGGDAFFFEGRNDADSDAGDVGSDGAIMTFSLTTGNVSIGKSSTVDTDRLFVTDGASPYSGANRMMQIKRNATNGNDTDSFASLLIGNNSNGFVIGYGGTTDRFRFLDGSGTERVSFANGGNVGIGTTAPSGALHINGANPTVFITNSTQDGASTLLRMTERKEVDGDAGGYLLYNGSGNRFEIGTNISGTDTVSISIPRDGTGKVGIGGEAAPSAPLEISDGTGEGQGSIGYNGTMIACSSASAQEYSDSNSATWGPKINISNETASSTRTAASLVFVHRNSSSGVAAIVSTNTATDRADLRFITRGTGNAIAERMRITDDGSLMIGDVSNANMTQGLTINQGANDDEIFCLKSSDVNHGHTNSVEADTFMRIHKHAAGTGGARIDAFSEAGTTPGMEINGYSHGTDNTRSTSGTANLIMAAIGVSGGNPADLAGDKNILVIRNRNTTRFVFDTDGDLFADNNVTSEAFDTYQDAHLLRTFDLSHGRGVIQSKFDDFIKYQHETLASLKLVGREKDGTPNHFVNVTGMQRLHNGAIWQQYTEMEKMKELMYDTMVQLLGKETADKKLEKHDIKLLDESLDVTDSLWSKVKNKAKSLFKIIK